MFKSGLHPSCHFPNRQSISGSNWEIETGKSPKISKPLAVEQPIGRVWVNRDCERSDMQTVSVKIGHAITRKVR